MCVSSVGAHPVFRQFITKIMGVTTAIKTVLICKLRVRFSSMGNETFFFDLMPIIDMTPTQAGCEFPTLRWVCTLFLYLILAGLNSCLTCFCNSLLRVISPLIKADVPTLHNVFNTHGLLFGKNRNSFFSRDYQILTKS